MNAVKNDFRRRLARAEATVSAIHPADVKAAEHRQRLRRFAYICQVTRTALSLMGLDPALAVSLKSGEEAAAELAAIPDTEALWSADKAITHNYYHDGGEEGNSVVAKIQRMAAYYSEGAQPDFARDSVAQLLAFCVASKKVAFGDRLPSSEETAGLPDTRPGLARAGA